MYRIMTIAHTATRLRATIGAFHRAFLRRPLPDKLALYLHSLNGHASTVEQFMRRFSDLGYDFVGPDEFLSRSGRMILLTFDDNFQSWYACLPMFDRLGAKATFYVNTISFRDRANDADICRFFSRISAVPEPTLTVGELRCLAEAGHTIGAHTHTHPNLADIPLDKAKNEIRTSKSILEDILLEPVTHFAYPYGMRRHFSRRLRRYCFEIGFKTVATGLPAMQYAKPQSSVIHRSVVQLDLPFERYIENLRVDGRIFERITGRNPVAG
jgi:peptidoglycan/xylan/chitin deacetylase (PgdA/CDA1 family)